MAKSPLPTIGGKFANAYLVLESDPTERLAFQVWPRDLNNGKAAEYSDFPVVGRSEPIRVYSHSSASAWNLTLMYVSSISKAEDPNITDEQKKILPAQAANFLHALVYPVYTGGISYPPPVVIFIVGDYISARCIAKNVAVAHNEDATWDPDSLLPMLILGSLTLEEVNKTPPSYDTIRSRNYGFGLYGQQSGNV